MASRQQCFGTFQQPFLVARDPRHRAIRLRVLGARTRSGNAPQFQHQPSSSRMAVNFENDQDLCTPAVECAGKPSPYQTPACGSGCQSRIFRPHRVGKPNAKALPSSQASCLGKCQSQSSLSYFLQSRHNSAINTDLAVARPVMASVSACHPRANPCVLACEATLGSHLSTASRAEINAPVLRAVFSIHPRGHQQSALRFAPPPQLPSLVMQNVLHPAPALTIRPSRPPLARLALIYRHRAAAAYRKR